jgi:hypothetical protein
VRWDTLNRKRKNDMTEKCKMVDDQLEQVSGGAGEEKKYYCVEGYSKAYGGNVKLYVSTYNDAVKLCEKLGLGTDCIKEVSGVH